MGVSVFLCEEDLECLLGLAECCTAAFYTSLCGGKELADFIALEGSQGPPAVAQWGAAGPD